MGLGAAAGLAAPAPEPSCLRALRPVAAGAVAVRADFETAACAVATPAFAYDQGLRLARTRRDLAAGEIVRGSEQLLASVRPGDRLIVESRVGLVVVQRAVTILRPAPGGAAVVVRTDDGRVFAVPAPAEREGR